MNPSKTADPTTGVDGNRPNDCLTRKTMRLASQLVQTNTLLDSQTTNTHPPPQPENRVTATAGISVPLPLPRTVLTRTEPCSSWSDPAEALSKGPRFRRGNEI